MEPGVYLVGTPIGNLEDVTLRSLRILADADVLACEDTRVTRRLFVRHGLPAPAILFSCHEHNERIVAVRLAALAREGKAVAYCTDAGMPGISDPGLHVAREAVRAGVRLEAIPGPSAVATAVSVSGLAAAPFTFFGFPSRRDGKLTKLLRLHGDLPPALVFYESPHRLARLLSLAAEHLGGERRAAVCLEITKKYERVIRDGLAGLSARFAGEAVKGEAVVVIEGVGNGKDAGDSHDDA